MDVTVDENFIRVNGKSYATNKITSVEVREDPSNLQGCASLMVVASAILLLASLAAPPMFFGSIPIAIGTYFMVKKAQQKHYKLFLITSAAEQQALDTKDKDLVQDLRSQIEAAMMKASRG